MPCAQLTQPFPSETSRDSPDSSEELQTCHFISGGSEAEAPIQQTFPEYLRRAGWALAGAEMQWHPAEAPCGGSGGDMTRWCPESSALPVRCPCQGADGQGL